MKASTATRRRLVVVASISAASRRWVSSKFVSAEHHVEQSRFGGRPLGECSSQLGDSRLLGSQVVAGGNVAAQIVDEGRGTECVRRRHDGEHRKHGDKRRSRASPDGKARSSGRALTER